MPVPQGLTDALTALTAAITNLTARVAALEALKGGATAAELDPVTAQVTAAASTLDGLAP